MVLFNTSQVPTRRLFLQALVMLVLIAGVQAVAPRAEAHNPDRMRARRAHVVRRAKSQVGVRYRWGSASPKRGFDCSGLTMWAHDGHGASLPHSSLLQYRLAGRPGFKRIKKRSRLVKGDLVFFDTSRSSKIGHVGIYTGKGKFVSATSAGVKIDSVYDKYYWGKRYRGATRVFG